MELSTKFGKEIPSRNLRENRSVLGSCGPGKLTEKGKALRGGCKRSFEPREQRSPKSLLHHPRLLLHRCNPILHRCKSLCVVPGSKRPFAPSPFSVISQARSS